MFCAGVKDGAIHHVENERLIEKFETGVPMSQLVMLAGKKALFASIAPELKPGSIWVILLPTWQKI